MAAKHRHPSAPTGRRGPRGKPGPAGPPGPPANGELHALAAHVAEIVKELHTQLTRIAQIQAQLDRLATGQPPEPVDRRRQPRQSN